MRPTNRFFLFALIIFVMLGTVPTVFASEPTAEDFTNAFTATCADPAMSHFGEITPSSQVDYYAIDLTAGQFFTIDVDAEKINSPLDSILEVFDASGELVAVSAESSSGMDISPDPYLEMTVDVAGTYYLAISAETTGAGADTGPYTLLLTCSTQPPAPEFTWPLKVGDLIGSTGSTGSLVNITPETAESSLPFDLGVGLIIDTEFDPGRELLLAVIDTVATIDDTVAVDAAVGVDYIPPRIVALDPFSGNEVASYSLGEALVVALEAAENELYGVQVDPDTEEHSLVLVTFDDTALTASLAPVFSFDKQRVRALAYHQSEKILYGASGTALLKIDLASEPVGIVEIPLTSLSLEIASMDFSHEDVLYVVDVEENLYEVTDLITGAVRLINPINGSDGVSGLTFVVGAAPGGVDPVGTICSSTLTASASTSSGTADPKLSRFKLKKNPLHRAVGLFKFEGMQGETITLNVELDGIESAEAAAAEESTASSEPENSLLNHWKGKGRVFLGIRDAIPDLDFRERTKDHIPFSMSATLPADGTYYVMIIRPLLRFYQTDYCLSLTSSLQEDSQAWKTFEVAWPNDESGDDTACTTAEESKDVQNDTETLAGASADDGSVSVTLSTTAIAPTSAPPEEPVAETPVGADPAAEGGDTEGGQSLAETPVVEPVVETPVVEPVAETPVVEPVAEIPVVEPGAEIPVVEPVVETPVVEPVAETPVVEPGVETPVVEPVAETPVVSEPAADGGDTTVEDPVVETVVDEPVVETPVNTDPAAEIGSETESVDDSISYAVGDDAPADEEYSDEPMEDPLPMKE